MVMPSEQDTLRFINDIAASHDGGVGFVAGLVLSRTQPRLVEAIYQSIAVGAGDETEKLETNWDAALRKLGDKYNFQDLVD